MPIGTRRSFGRFRDLRRKLILCALLSLMTLGMGACGFGSSEDAGPNPGQKQSTAADPRTLATPASQDGRFSVDTPSLQDVNGNNPRAGPLGDVKPLELKPGGSLGSLGLNTKTFLSDELKDPDARLDRLENAVSAMHTDMSTLAPAMQRMAMMEKDIEALVSQLETLLQEEGGTAQAVPPQPVEAPQPLSPMMDIPAQEDPAAQATAPPPRVQQNTIPKPPAATPVPDPAPTPATTPTTPPASTPAPIAAQVDGTNVTALRLGEHADKTRMVFDINGPVTFRTDLDNGEKLLVIEIDGAGWSTAATKAMSSPLIQSYSTQALDGGKGTRIIMVLKRDSSIISQSVLKPDGANPNHRLMIDLKK